RPGGPPRRGARRARSQRRRQEHGPGPAHRPDRRRCRPGVPVRRRPAPAGDAPEHRRDAARSAPAGHPARARAHRPALELLRPCPAGGREPGPGRADGPGPPSLRRPVRRRAAAGAVRPGPVRPAGADVRRRAHHRPGRRGQAQLLAGDPPPARRGRGHRADHALPGRGRRARRPRRPAGRRPRARRGQPGAAEAAGGRQQRQRPQRPVARRRRRLAGSRNRPARRRPAAGTHRPARATAAALAVCRSLAGRAAGADAQPGRRLPRSHPRAGRRRRPPGGHRMNTTVSIATRAPAPSLARIYVTEAWYELLRLLRTPAFALPTMLFPVVFYGLFGIVLPGSYGSFDKATYLLATFGVFAVIGPALFGFGVGMAIEREQGWLELKRVSPMPPGAYFFGKIATGLLFALTVVLLLSALGFGFGNVKLGLGRWLLLVATLLLGTLPF